MQISKKLPRLDDHIQLGLLDRISNFLIFVFAFINFLSLISFSSLSIAHPSIGIEVSRLFKITIIIFAISSFFLPKTPKQLIYWTVGIFFIIIDYRTNDNLTFFSELLLLGLSVGSLRINFKKVLRLYLFSTLLGTCLIIFLSIINYLPIDGQQSSVLFSNYQNIVFCFGFVHPNAFGTALFSATISFLFLYSKKYKKLSIFFILMVVFFDFLIGAQTAAVGVAIFGIGICLNYTKTQNKVNKIFKILYVLPIILTIFSLFLAKYPNTSIYDWLNEHIASRPSLWNYYITNYPPHIFDNSIDIDLSSVNHVYGNGVLDGSYIYYLLHFGYVGLIILLLTMFAINQKTFLTKNNLYGWSFVTICCVAFPETNFTLFFFNPFLLIFFFNQLGSEQKQYF
ncbi:hypothetical protein ATX31_09300 [Oenococcus oeni]|uniref:hypothetical protein n=1 Tax=Oenococcus oeni TaxID=1247 RepID=UPI0008F7E684|nr:hypothetical protein [Oenococcus oeni]OIL70897.1 hypothetical protein ATX31_09300 [Oenococcus oeni]